MKKNQIKLVGLLLAFVMLFAFSSAALAADPYFQGSGTVDDPYKISNSTDLVNLSELSNQYNSPYVKAGVYFVVTNNIDMTGYDWVPIGPNSSRIFYGDFNGSGFTISNLENTTVTSTTKGFFGWVGGKLYNLNLTYVNITGYPNGATIGMGGAIGVLHTNGVIDNVKVTGTINVAYSGRNSGGVVGAVLGSNARISNSSFDGEIIGETSGNTYLGGVVGFINYGGLVVENCYSAGSITRPGTGGADIGKIAGINWGTFTEDYSTMTIDATSNLGYWVGNDGIEGTPPWITDPGVKTGLGVRYDDGAVAVKNADRLAVATLWIKANSGTPSFVGLNNFTVLDETTVDGLYRVTLGYMVAGGQGFTSANAGLGTISGATGVTIERAKFASYDDNGNAVNTAYYLEKETGGGVVIPPGDDDPPVVPVNYDLNNDGAVDQLDLAIALKYFMTVQIADFNKDGVVDIEDFILLLNHMTF